MEEKLKIMNKIKNIIIISFLIFLQTILVADIFDDFKNQFQQQYVDPVTKDLTAITCGNSLNSGDSLDLFSVTPPSIGLSIRVTAPMKKINEDNIIFKNSLKDVEYVFLPIIQIEKGLPAKIDLILRGMSLNNMTFYGVGIKYCLFKSPIPMMPQVSVAGFYNQLTAKDILSLNSNSISAIVSFGIPVVKPYLIIGLDNGELKVDENVVLGGITGKLSGGLRYEAGINFSVLPIMYINFSYGQAYGDTLMSLGLGLKF
jgi:hypothetical protein